MFAAYNDRGDLATSQIDSWAEQAWPNGSKTSAHGWTIWSDGRTHQLPLINQNSVAITDGVIWYENSVWGSDISALLERDLLAGWPLSPRWDGSFAAVVLQTDLALIGIEGSGLRRCYWGRGASGGTVIASLQVPVAIGLRSDVDLAGVAQLLSLGHTLGTRTLFEGCKEVWPGSSVRLTPTKVDVQQDLDNLVNQDQFSDNCIQSVGDAAEFLIPTLQNSASMAFDSFERPAIALSGGTDSRLALGALLPSRPPVAAYSYGDPAEADVTIAEHLARLANIPHATVDLRGELFPLLPQTRDDALRCEATWNPAWFAVSSELVREGHDVLLMGDVTDSLQVRVASLWGRKERVLRELNRLTRRGSLASEIPVGEWWDARRSSIVDQVVKGRDRFLISMSVSDLVAAVEQDMHETWCIARLERYTSALDAEDSIQISVARQQAGSQVNALGGGVMGHSIFGSRGAAKAARSVGLDIRADRALLRELTIRLLPPEMGRMPTATIPLVGPTAPLPVQNAMWLTRFSGDWLLRRANRVARGSIPRERVVKAQELPYEYRLAGPDFFLGNDWTISGSFSPLCLIEEYRRMVAGVQIPMYPMSQYTAVRADTMIARVAGLG